MAYLTSGGVLIRSDSCAVRAWGPGVREIPPCRTFPFSFLPDLRISDGHVITGRACVAAALESVDDGASYGGMSDGCAFDIPGGSFAFAIPSEFS